MLILRVTSLSVFARKCLMLVHEKDIFDKLELRNTDLYGDNLDVDEDNPLRKVPALRLEDGTTLFDSPVICEYLDCLDGDPHFHPQSGPERFKALRLQALGDALTEAAQSFSKEGMRPDRYRSPEMLDKYNSAIERILDWIQAHMDILDGPMSIGSLSLTCAIAYAEKWRTDTPWREPRPHLTRWYQTMCDRASFDGTSAEANEKRLGATG